MGKIIIILILCLIILIIYWIILKEYRYRYFQKTMKKGDLCRFYYFNKKVTAEIEEINDEYGDVMVKFIGGDGNKVYTIVYKKDIYPII
jgi:hypothetical protein